MKKAPKGGVVVVGDVHLDNYARFSREQREGYSDRLLDLLNYMQFVRDYAARQEAVLIWLGDIFHTVRTGYVSVHVVSAPEKYVHVPETDKELREVFIRGNHDCLFGTHGPSPLHLLLPVRAKESFLAFGPSPGEPPNTFIHVFRNMDIPVCVMALPYLEGSALQSHLVQVAELAEKDPVWGEDGVFSVFAAHLGLNEDAARYGGLDIPGLMSIDDIPDYYDLAVFGHFHNPRTFDDDVYIVGSMGMLSFAEDPDNYFGPWHYVLDKHGNVRRYMVDGFLQTMFSGVPVLPKFRTVTSEDMTQGDIMGNFVRIVAPDSKSAVKWKEQAISLGARAVEVTTQAKQKNKQKRDKVGSMRAKPRDVLMDYMEYSPPEPPKEVVLEYHDSIEQEVRE